MRAISSFGNALHNYCLHHWGQGVFSIRFSLPAPFALHTERGSMDYRNKLDKMDRHLADNPKDYQTVISRMKVYSKYVDSERRKRINERLKNVAKYRRELNEERA